MPKAETPFLAGKDAGARSGKSTTVKPNTISEPAMMPLRKKQKGGGRFWPSISFDSSGIESTDVLDEFIVCCRRQQNRT